MPRKRSPGPAPASPVPARLALAMLVVASTPKQLADVIANLRWMEENRPQPDRPAIYREAIAELEGAMQVEGEEIER